MQEISPNGGQPGARTRFLTVVLAAGLVSFYLHISCSTLALVLVCVLFGSKIASGGRWTPLRQCLDQTSGQWVVAKFCHATRVGFTPPPRALQISAKSENAIVLVRISNQLEMRNADLVDSITVDLCCKGTGTELVAHGSKQVRK